MINQKLQIKTTINNLSLHDALQNYFAVSSLFLAAGALNSP
jgi:hypothetical protein